MSEDEFVNDELLLDYHLMHPGGDSAPGDPNAAFYLDGVCHLHYILRHPWRGGHSFSFVHVSSEDLLNWTWHPTKLQPAFTGHGMFSGTGFVTKEGRPAAIYHGQASGWNQIAVAKDNALSEWEKPYAVEPKTADGAPAEMRHWDPDCFQIGDTYYAISGGTNPPLIKSQDLRDWTLVGDFLQHDYEDIAYGEDISCPNFFPLDGRWVLLCISHPMGCRNYVGDWDAEAEQFVPTHHARMSWRRPDQSALDTAYRDFFAPESVRTPDGRRVMWAWLTSLDDELAQKSIQSLPRELRVGDDGTLRMRPLRELETLRYDAQSFANVTVTPPDRPHSGQTSETLTELDGDAFEIVLHVARSEAGKKRFGLQLFASDNTEGLPVVIKPETGSVLVGTTEAPFAVKDLPEDEDVEIRVYVDKYLVEVFVNDRQAVVTAHRDPAGRTLKLYSYGRATTFGRVTIWRLRATNEGIKEARENRVWEPKFD